VRTARRCHGRAARPAANRCSLARCAVQTHDSAALGRFALSQSVQLAWVNITTSTPAGGVSGTLILSSMNRFATVTLYRSNDREAMPPRYGEGRLVCTRRAWMHLLVTATRRPFASPQRSSRGHVPTPRIESRAGRYALQGQPAAGVAPRDPPAVRDRRRTRGQRADNTLPAARDGAATTCAAGKQQQPQARAR